MSQPWFVYVLGVKSMDLTNKRVLGYLAVVVLYQTTKVVEHGRRHAPDVMPPES